MYVRENLKKNNFSYLERCFQLILTRLGTQVSVTGGGWDWLRIMSCGELLF